MRSEKGGLIIVVALFLLMFFLWGGSYVYFRQTRAITVYSTPCGAGPVLSNDDPAYRQIQYCSLSRGQTILYYLHLPWNRLEVLVHKQAAPHMALRDFVFSR